MSYKIFFSNIGYAKGIDGSLSQHVMRAGRHFYCASPIQEQILSQVKAIIDTEKPDLCCFVEIDQGSFQSAGLNQIEALTDEIYHFHDVADKYGPDSRIGRMLFHKGRSNGFLAREIVSYKRLYFRHGAKRLIYHISAPGGLSVFFAHFSLNKDTRKKQMEELKILVQESAGEVVVLADFNIMSGFKELEPLLKDGALILLNHEDRHTFTFHRRKLALDLCLCSKSLAEKALLKIIPQPFSDHAALLLELKDSE